MDFDSREVYRKQVSRIARYSDSTEKRGCSLGHPAGHGRQAAPHIVDERVHVRRAHVGLLPFIRSRIQKSWKSRTSAYHPPASSTASAMRCTVMRRLSTSAASRSLPSFSSVRVLLPLIPNHSPSSGGVDPGVSAPAHPRDPGRGGPGQQHQSLPSFAPCRCRKST